MSPLRSRVARPDPAVEEQFDQFSAELLECYQQISLLQQIPEDLGQLLDRCAIARTALAMATHVTRARRGAFYAGGEERWQRIAVTGNVAEQLPSEWLTFFQSRELPLLQNRPDSLTLEHAETVAAGFASLLVTPVIGQGRLVGILAVFDTRKEEFDSSDTKMLQAIALQAATALNNEEHHRQLMCAQEELLVSQKFAAMGEMAAEIGHELNNYLTGILGQVEIMQALIDSGIPESLADRLRAIVTQVDKMSVLTDGLLRCSRQQLKARECHLADIVSEAVTFVTPQNRFDSVKFRISIPEDLPPVQWDPNHIQQIFMNLFTNAADAMGKNGGNISVSAHCHESGRVQIHVSDDGPGIPEHIRNRIFEPRFTTKDMGNGFGLAVCFRVIQDHGGTIRLSSPPHQGATFSIELPAKPTTLPSSSNRDRPDDGPDIDPPPFLR